MKTPIDQLAIEERKAYFKKWRYENKDKVKRHNDLYWQRRAERKHEELVKGVK